MYCLKTSIHDRMITYIQYANTLKEALDEISKKIFIADTTIRNLQPKSIYPQMIIFLCF